MTAVGVASKSPITIGWIGLWLSPRNQQAAAPLAGSLEAGVLPVNEGTVDLNPVDAAVLGCDPLHVHAC